MAVSEVRLVVQLELRQQTVDLRGIGIGLNLVTVAASHDEARTGQPRPCMSINRLGI